MCDNNPVHSPLSVVDLVPKCFQGDENELKIFSFATPCIKCSDALIASSTFYLLDVYANDNSVFSVRIDYPLCSLVPSYKLNLSSKALFKRKYINKHSVNGIHSGEVLAASCLSQKNTHYSTGRTAIVLTKKTFSVLYFT